MPIELNRLPERRIFYFGLKERELFSPSSISFSCGVNDRARVDSLVYVKRYSWNRKACPFGLSSPVEKWLSDLLEHLRSVRGATYPHATTAPHLWQRKYRSLTLLCSSNNQSEEPLAQVSLPLLVDRNVTASEALSASWRAANANRRLMFRWGLIVTGLLILGSAPLFVGLAFVLPWLGYSTWHLYTRLIDREAIEGGRSD